MASDIEPATDEQVTKLVALLNKLKAAGIESPETSVNLVLSCIARIDQERQRLAAARREIEEMRADAVRRYKFACDPYHDGATSAYDNVLAVLDSAADAAKGEK